MNAKHGPVIIGNSEIAVVNKRHLILLLSMQCISQCLAAEVYNTSCNKVYKDHASTSH